MINIVCKKCGWRLPFNSRVKKDSLCCRGKNDIFCPKCGKILIRKGGKTNKWY